MLKPGFSFGGVIERTLPNREKNEVFIPSSVQDSAEKWMSLALLEAMNGIGWASPNPAVGCVIVHQGKMISKGFTQAYGGKHAERMAFESLAREFDLNALSDLEVYVTLEPCSHTGKQPPCVDLLLHPSVRKVWVACGDPHLLVNGKGLEILRAQGKEVTVGVLREEAEAWHFPFLQYQKKKKPLWVGKWAENEQGLLADANGESRWITNAQSRAYTHWLRQKYDAILVGAGTWMKDYPSLTVRDCAEPHRRNPQILIFDPKSTLDPSTLRTGVRIYQQKEVGDAVSAVEQTNFGFELQSVFCEGGAATLNELFKRNKIDVVHRFVGKKDFGSTSASSPHRIREFLPDSKHWKNTTAYEFGNDLLREWVNCS